MPAFNVLFISTYAICFRVRELTGIYKKEMCYTPVVSRQQLSEFE